MDDVVLVAITGGFATGKTTAARIIEEMGYKVLFTDDIAQILMNEDVVLKKEIISEFGSLSYNETGLLSRSYISEIVFASTKEADEKLTKMNQIVHPKVIDEMMRQIEELAKSGEKLIFVESALIFEAELEDGFDFILVVASKEENQIKRAKEKHKLTSSQAKARIDKQISMVEKIKYADFTINNDTTIEELLSSLQFLVPVLASLEPKKDD